MKKLVSFCLAFLLAVSLSINAFAATRTDNYLVNGTVVAVIRESENISNTYGSSVGWRWISGEFNPANPSSLPTDLSTFKSKWGVSGLYVHTPQSVPAIYLSLSGDFGLYR